MIISSELFSCLHHQMLIIHLQMTLNLTKQQVDLPLTLGPLKFNDEIPTNLLEIAYAELLSQFKTLNPNTVTDLSLGNGLFPKHLNKLKPYIKWIQQYKLKRLVTLDCSENPYIRLRQLELFSFQNLQKLLLSDCKIESIQNLGCCSFPNLAVIVLYNNNITNINSLKKCNHPFLMEFIADSNIIMEISQLHLCWNTYLQIIQLQNNRINNMVPILRCNYPRLQETRFDDYIGKDEEDSLSTKMRHKFPNL